MVFLLSNAQSSGWSDLITGAQNDKRNDPAEEVVTPWHLLACGSEQWEKADTLQAHQDTCTVGATYPRAMSRSRHMCS